jgi:hypothetical protein
VLLPPYGFYCTPFACVAIVDYVPEANWHSPCVEVWFLHRVSCAFCCLVYAESIRQERIFDVFFQVSSYISRRMRGIRGIGVGLCLSVCSIVGLCVLVA